MHPEPHPKTPTMTTHSKDIYHIDYETYSPEDIGEVGAFKYIAHPDAEILIMAIAKNDEQPVAWSVLDDNVDALMLLQEAVESGAEIWAHNAQFELAVSQQLFASTFGIPLPQVEQWHCTAALCRLAAIPSSLEKAGAFLGTTVQKDAEGDRLIKKFSCPQKPTKKDPRTRILASDDPEDFGKFVRYCLDDVRTEQAIYRQIKPIDQPNPGQRGYRADARMNLRGIPVNVDALRRASALIEEYEARLIPRFRAQTASADTVTLPITSQRKTPKVVSLEEGFNPTQTEMLKAWLKLRGFTGDNLQAETVEWWLNEGKDILTPQAFAALETFSQINYAAVKKIPAMLRMAMADGYVRGALMVYGAERTHRWTGKGIQPQNFARPSIKFTELAYWCICNGATIEEIEDLFGPLYQVLASCIRHFIQPHDGMVLQADYSAIEARVAPWLVNAEPKLEAFRRKEPIYENMGSKIFHVPVEEVDKDQRFLGKQAELGCTYNMGRPKFRGTCESYGFTPSAKMIADYKPRHKAFVKAAMDKVRNDMARKFEGKGIAIPTKFSNEDFIRRKTMANNKWTTLDPETEEEWSHFTYDDLADRAVTAWRADNPIIVKSWRELDVAAKSAIENPGETFTVGKLQFCMKDTLGYPCLFMKLPSGHFLCYPKAQVEPNTAKGWGTHIRFWGIIPNSGGNWGWCSTYGGKLLENATQACAGDIMREGMYSAETAGYLPFMLVHDELLAFQLPGQTHQELCRLLCTMPGWAKGLPLDAEGSTIPFYKK